MGDNTLLPPAFILGVWIMAWIAQYWWVFVVALLTGVLNWDTISEWLPAVGA